MKDGNPVAECGAKAVNRLRGERDLGNEDDRRLPTVVNNSTEQLDVHQRLPAPRDSVKEEHVAFLGGRHRVDGVLLRRGRLQSRRGDAATSGEGIALDLFVLDDYQAALLERLEHR